ncbi:branched-chain amino acid ABC transporter permease [Prosthecomicrobium hirschii]|uniref:Amino acid ABC transporter permease n=1 Tax=Prosthecodimorpha hirschii TaxID=665126 RepID=A0A0P6VRV4_9HYPH|nr:branched-chain amino acid ABC transporter permease [Prosthecomicrobium hirschii]KPL53339.1 amino acid ABC transporter permease [Prosthecomicrobium hirschii]MCW1842392.1 branched-chain amino acid ABC transporter permease [Prosthecomicrobium hirschii]TPQ50012.1 branched-chain amino acid ABC transporter permease [Prosthecomicrobium hirschii]
MALTDILFALINGAATGSAVFLVAAGLTLIFGILKILNFAHGAFFMIGAYVAYSIIGSNPSSLHVFIAAAFAAAAAVAALGFVADRLVLRRLRHVDEAYMLIATFAVLLVCTGVVKLIWGVNYASINPPPLLDGAVTAGSLFVPSYSLFVIAAGLFVFLGLELVIHRTWIGKLLQAVASDSWMSGVLGINVPAALTVTVIASFALAGLAGGLLLANQTLSPILGESYLLLAFMAVIIGGLGNVRGAFIASLLLGTIESGSSLVIPNMPGMATYIFVILFLLAKPQGLIGGRHI